jgi:hypothetical protein
MMQAEIPEILFIPKTGKGTDFSVPSEYFAYRLCVIERKFFKLG